MKKLTNAQKKELENSSSFRNNKNANIEYSNFPIFASNILKYKWNFPNVFVAIIFLCLYNNKSKGKFILSKDNKIVNNRLKNYLLKSNFSNIENGKIVYIFEEIKIRKSELTYKFTNDFLSISKPNKDETYLGLDLNFINQACFSNMTDFMGYVLSQAVVFKKSNSYRFTTEYLSDFLHLNKKITKDLTHLDKYLKKMQENNNVTKIYYSHYNKNKKTKKSSIKISFSVKLKHNHYKTINRNNEALITKATEKLAKDVPNTKLKSDENLNLSIMLSSRVNTKIAGEGGTGKTTLVQKFFKHKRRTQPLTPTNSVAQDWIKAGFPKTRTLHSYFLMGTSHLTWDQMYLRLSKTARGTERIEELRSKLISLKTLIIDEDSMVSEAQFEYMIDCIKHLVGEQKLEEMTFVCIGDSGQMRPVAPIEETSNYEKESSHIYNSDVYKSLKFEVCELTEKKRATDSKLEELQEKTFNATDYTEVISALEEADKKIESYTGSFNKNTIVIAGRNETVDLYNNEVQAKNPNLAWVFGYELLQEEISYLKKKKISYKESYEQTFKIGDKIRFYQTPKNNSYKVFDKKTKKAVNYGSPVPYNGLIGVVVDLDNKSITIATDEFLYKFTEKSTIYIKDDKGNQTKVSYKAFPMELAYAITCHKIQGKTISESNDIVIFPYDFFEHNSFEVALGRGRKLSQYKFVDHTNLYKRNGWFDFKLDKDSYSKGLIVSDEAKEIKVAQKKKAYKAKTIINRALKEALSLSEKEESKIDSKSKTRLKSIQEMDREEKLAIVDWLDVFKNEYDTISILASNSTSSASLINGDGFGLLMNTFIMYRLYDEKGPHTGKLRHLYKRDQKLGIDRTRELENLEDFVEDIMKPLKRRIADNVDLFFLLLTVHSIANQARISTDKAFYCLVNSTKGKQIKYYENKRTLLHGSYGREVLVDEYYSFFKYGLEAYRGFDLSGIDVEKDLIYWKNTWYKGYDTEYETEKDAENYSGLQIRNLVYDLQIDKFFNKKYQNSAVLYAEELIGKEADEFTDDDWVMLIDDRFSNLEF